MTTCYGYFKLSTNRLAWVVIRRGEGSIHRNLASGLHQSHCHSGVVSGVLTQYLPGEGQRGKKLESWRHVKLSRCKEKTLQSMQRPVLLCHVGRGEEGRVFR